jgi:hypothetical protein
MHWQNKFRPVPQLAAIYRRSHRCNLPMGPVKAAPPKKKRVLIGMRQTLDNLLVQNKQVDYDGRSVF